MTLEATGGGLLYWAPADTEWPADEWVPLGVAESCDLLYEEDPASGAVIRTPLDGRCMSVSFPVSAISPAGYWLLFRRRHPRIRAMHSAYRRKTKNR
jgi:hypothetical protein